MRILQIDQRGQEAIIKLNSYAEQHKIYLESIKKMASKELRPVGDDANYSCYLHDGYRVVYSIEEHPSGWYRHISISVDDIEKLPSVPATEAIMKEFGFKGTVTDCDNVWIEPNIFVITSGLVNAVNLIQKYE